MPSVLEIAERAGVSIDELLRALSHEAGGEESREVAEALAELGPPDATVVESLNVLTTAREAHAEAARPPESNGRAAQEQAPAESPQTVARVARERLLATLAETAAELEARLREGPGEERAHLDSAGPGARQLRYMDALVEELARALDALREGVEEEQRGRVDDAMLLLSLIVAGWRSVERRLELVERTLDGLATAQPPPHQE